VNPSPHITHRFPLGEIVATRGLLSVLERSGQPPLLFLIRHARGDWGEVGKEDSMANDEGLANGGRLLSAYRTSLGEWIWIITEWDRSVTTLLLPNEY
jgi:hypothetical protein